MWRKRSYNSTRRPGDRGPLRLEESPDTEGQDAGATQAAKADGKWHRKETADRRSFSPETPRQGRKGGVRDHQLRGDPAATQPPSGERQTGPAPRRPAEGPG